MAKLSPRYCGPFTILKKVEVAYKLALPEHSKVHPIFHVSLLKKYVPNANHVLQDNSNLKDDGSLQVKPEFILDHRVHQLRSKTLVEVLVKWNMYPVKDATWVDLDVLQSEFPTFQL